MLTTAELVAWILLLLALLPPVVWAWRFLWFYGHYHDAPASEAKDLPQVVVILSLRGADPTLVNCLAGLLHQDYPHYSLRIVIDSREDPAWDLVTQVLARQKPEKVEARVLVRENRFQTCSLKISSQLQVLAELEEEIGAVVLVDADVAPGRNWLRSLVYPLRDPEVGAALGIRWFAPAQPGWGTLVRHLWNAAAFTQMLAFRIPWGGSLALSAQAARHPRLQQQWAHSFCEDTGLYGLLRGLGWRVAFVPPATMVNSENIDLAGCFFFLRRQLLCARLHHVRWWPLFAANLATGLAFVATAVWLLASLWAGTWTTACWLGGLLGFYSLGLFLAFVPGEVLIRRRVCAQGRDIPPPLWSWKLPLAGVLAQLLQLAGLISVLFLRRVEWRGISYLLEGRGKIRLLEYRPYQPQSCAGPEDGSLL